MTRSRRDRGNACGRWNMGGAERMRGERQAGQGPGRGRGAGSQKWWKMRSSRWIDTDTTDVVSISIECLTYMALYGHVF
jgi:hypothetical protein